MRASRAQTLPERIAVFHELGIEGSEQIGIAEEAAVGVRNDEVEF